MKLISCLKIVHSNLDLGVVLVSREFTPKSREILNQGFMWNFWSQFCIVKLKIIWILPYQSIYRMQKYYGVFSWWNLIEIPKNNHHFGAKNPKQMLIWLKNARFFPWNWMTTPNWSLRHFQKCQVFQYNCIWSVKMISEWVGRMLELLYNCIQYV